MGDGEARNGDPDQHVAEIGRKQDVELHGLDSLAHRPVSRGAVDPGQLVGGHLFSDVAIGLLGALRQPFGRANQKDTDGPDHDGDRRLGHPEMPPLIVEQMHDRQGHHRSHDAAGRGRGEIETEGQAAMFKGRRQHVSAGDQGHHLVADPAQGRAQEIDHRPMGDAEAGEAAGHHRRAERQRRPHADPAYEEGGGEGRGAGGGAQKGEPQPRLRPTPVFFADHIGQDDAQGRIGGRGDQKQNQAERRDQQPGSPFDLGHLRPFKRRPYRPASKPNP